ncbi:MAG: protein kinase [Planctomycetaceae bacterium]|nr:protein kinase [Planctomycetaceae bacterium]
MVRFEITAGPHAGEAVEFSSHQSWVVGRSGQAQLSLPNDPGCSRFHCRFEISPPECQLTDLNSTNGTLINGQRIVGVRSLRDQDEVSIGHTRIRVTIPPRESVGGGMDATFIAAPEQQHPEIPGFRITRKLGQGGMGTVFHAIQLQTQREVAVKILDAGATNGSAGLQHFLREAAIAMQLKHPNIVETMEFGVHDLSPYLVMEFINEVPLGELLQSSSPAGRMRIAAGIGCRLLDALSFAHQRNIVHRDVKPSNLIGFRSGRKLQVKLADFGLAKNFANAGLTAISRSTDVKGTLAYMAPEQVLDCRYAKPACDLYAAGACLYEFLTGRKPYNFTDAAQGFAMILNQAPEPIEKLAPEVPEGLVHIVRTAMSRSPEDRFPDAATMKQALDVFTRRETYQADSN